MAVVTISRKYASGGRKIGKLVAKRLNYDYVDKYYFQMLAEKLHVSEGTLESFERGKRYHFHLVASMDWRRKSATKTLGVLPSRVDGILEERDISHAWFLRTMCGGHYDDPGSFHLTLNMDLIPLEKATDLIETSLQYFMASV